MRKRLILSAIAGIGVAFMASLVAWLGTRALLVKSHTYQLLSVHSYLTNQLDAHRVAAGGYPASLAELNLQDPSRDYRYPFRFDDHGTPLDPWGVPYVYERVGDSYSLQSFGSDGRPGGRGTAADVAFPPDGGRPTFESMTWWQFMRDHATIDVVGTSVLAGICTFLAGMCGSYWRRNDDATMPAFVVAILVVSLLSTFVGGVLATWHVPIGEHH